jgi:hypothetical protein
MSPVIELIPMQCVRCQNPLLAQPDEVFWVCATCGQAQLLSDERGLLPELVHYAAGIPANDAKSKPIWVVQGQVALSRQTYRGDESRDMLQFWAQPRTFFIPAYSLPLDQLMDTCLGLLRQPVTLQEGHSPASFYPVTVHPEDLQALVEYMVVAVEAERKDMLKELDFKVQLGKAELWIVP